MYTIFSYFNDMLPPSVYIFVFTSILPHSLSVLPHSLSVLPHSLSSQLLSLTFLTISRSCIHTISALFPFLIPLFTPAIPLLFLFPFLYLLSPLSTLPHSFCSSSSFSYSSSFSFFPDPFSSSLNLPLSSALPFTTPPPHNISLSHSLFPYPTGTHSNLHDTSSLLLHCL